MKKIIAMLLVMAVCFGLVACGNNTSTTSNTTTTPVTDDPAASAEPEPIVENETEPEP